MGNWDKVVLLTHRLNAGADAIQARHHKMELVPFRGMFFVTCSRSPLFLWKLPMTHHDIGRNLDYFAPGHILMDSDEYLQNDRVYDEFRKYNDMPVNLFNHSMRKFGLDYEFKCVVMTKPRLEPVVMTMADLCPPPLS